MGGDMSIYGLDVGFKAESFENYNSRMAISEQLIINEIGTDRIREVI